MSQMSVEYASSGAVATCDHCGATSDLIPSGWSFAHGCGIDPPFFMEPPRPPVALPVREPRPPKTPEQHDVDSAAMDMARAAVRMLVALGAAIYVDGGDNVDIYWDDDDTPESPETAPA